MKVQLEKIGVGCDICVARSKENCGRCERNVNILQLKDFFKRPEKKPPAPPPELGNQKGAISEANRGELASWGYRPPQKPVSDRFQSAAPDQQERPRPSPPPEGLDLGGGTSGPEGEGARS